MTGQQAYSSAKERRRSSGGGCSSIGIGGIDAGARRQ